MLVTPLLKQEVCRRGGEESFSKTTTKKSGVSKLPIVLNEFGGCMLYGRCCTGCDDAPGMSFPSFLPCRVFSKGLIFSAFAVFYLSGKGGDRKMVPFLLSSLYRISSYAHLGNIWSSFCQNRGSFYVPLLYTYRGMEK